MGIKDRLSAIAVSDGAIAAGLLVNKLKSTANTGLRSYVAVRISGVLQEICLNGSRNR